jgi:hypothetical protein
MFLSSLGMHKAELTWSISYISGRKVHAVGLIYEQKVFLLGCNHLFCSLAENVTNPGYGDDSAICCVVLP